MVTRRDYRAEAVQAAKSVVIEIFHLLREYSDDVVLVGGWIPELMLSGAERAHIGSMDVDLALNHRKLQDEGYRRIRKLLLDRGYEQGKQPHIFLRRIQVGDSSLTVEVDLLAGEYGGTGKRRRHQRIQVETLARKARGCDLAFEINPMEMVVEGVLPGGGKDSATVRLASVVTFLVMKGMALDARLKEKDAWDIDFVLQNYPGGLEALVLELRPHVGHALVREGLQKIGKAFSSTSGVGATFVADFDEIEDREERRRVQRSAYERVNYLLGMLGGMERI